MVVGILLGKTVQAFMNGLRSLEFGAVSQINIPIAVLIWPMITPMMMKVDFGATRNVGRRPRGLGITLFVNWLVKPFSMAAIAWLFFRHIFASWIPASDSWPHSSLSSPSKPRTSRRRRCTSR
jgi:ACR3 family arsenite transporter